VFLRNDFIKILNKKRLIKKRLVNNRKETKRGKHMEIFIENIQDKIEITDEILELMEKAIKMCLEHEKFEYPYEVSIILTDNEKIRAR